MNVEQLLEPVLSRLRLIVGRCVISAIKQSGGERTADVELCAGEKRRGLEFLQQYGFSSRPKGIVSGLCLFPGGSRDHGVVISSNGDEIFVELKEGEVCMNSPFGQQVFLKEDGSVLIQSGNGVVKVDGELQVTKEVTANFGTAPVKLSTHIHGTGVGPSSPPQVGT